MYEQDNSWDGVEYLDAGPWLVGQSRVETIGILNAGIGARFALGK
jgi:hypothetical protein